MKCRDCPYLMKKTVPFWCLLQGIKKVQRPDNECTASSDDYALYKVDDYKGKEKK